MPRFRIKGANRQTGEDYDEVIDLNDLAAAKAYAEKKEILVEEIAFAPLGKPLGKAESVVATEGAEPISADQYQMLKLREIAESARKIHFWVRFFGIIALVSMILGLLSFILAITDNASKSPLGNP